MDNVLISLIFVFAMTTALPPGMPKKYRDYEYNRKTDAFYKLHTTPMIFSRAQKQCAVEGATLVLPTSHADKEQIHAMMKAFPDIGDSVFITNDGEEHASTEETPIINLTPTSEEDLSPKGNRKCEVMTRDMEILFSFCYDTHPFVCKVDAKDAPYDQVCKAYGAGYKSYLNVGSCYVVPPIPLSWNEAFAECRAMGAHLVVINSEAESAVVKEVLKSVPPMHFARTTYFFFAGIRASKTENDRVWKTIFNETLEEAGFSQWSPGEPNNHQNKEDCGTIFSSNGLYNDVTCTDQYGFICEKELPR